jgi:hypothetical protein
MARAFDALTPERGGRMGVTHAIVGTISVYQIAEWATAHVARHNRQAKRVLGYQRTNDLWLAWGTAYSARRLA